MDEKKRHSIASLVPYIDSLRGKTAQKRELERLFTAISRFFTMIISVNLTKNRYYMMEYEHFTTKKARIEGVFDDLIKVGASTMHPSYKDAFIQAFSRQALLSAYKKGRSAVHFEGRQMGDDGVYHWNTSDVVFVENPYDDDVLQITFSRAMDKEKQMQLESIRLHDILNYVMIGNYEYVGLIKVEDSSYELLLEDPKASHRFAKKGDYDQSIRRLSDTLIRQDNRDKFYHEASLKNVAEQLKDTGQYSFRYRLEDTPERRFREAVYLYVSPEKKEILFTVRDVHTQWEKEQEEKANAELRASEERHRILAELSNDIVFDKDLRSGQTVMFGDFKKAFGRDPVLDDFPYGEIDAGMGHPDDMSVIKAGIHTIVEGARQTQFDFRMKCGSGEYCWCHYQMIVLDDKRGLPRRHIARLQNIDEQKRLEFFLLLKSQKDPLTGFYNRQAMQELVDDFLNHEGKDGTHALFFIDLDRFEDVNITYGRKVGDEILSEMARRLTSAFRATDIISRSGGDEFSVLVQNTTSSAAVLRKAKEICEEINRPFEVGESIFSALSCSIGVALSPSYGVTFEILYENARSAQAAVKKCGRNDAMLFEESLLLKGGNVVRAQSGPVQESLPTLPIIRALCTEDAVHIIEQALADEEFEVYLQPKIRLKDRTVYGAEALVRWKHPSYGLIMPGSFISILEQKRLIGRLDAYMFQKTCALIKKWISEGKDPIPISVNQARRFLASDGYLDFIDKTISDYRISPDRIMIEVTESSIWDSSNKASIIQTMNELRKRGFRTEIDDFGNGYTSLHLLSTLDVDGVKIDKSFIDGEYSSRMDLIVGGIVHLCKSIGSFVVIEGVETPDQEARMKKLGCDIAQGYLYAKPMPIDQFESFLEEQKKK